MTFLRPRSFFVLPVFLPVFLAGALLAQTGDQQRSSPTRRKSSISGTVLPAQGDSGLPQVMTLVLTSNRGYREIRQVREDGSFEFDNLDPGPYTLTLTAPGRRTVRKSVDVGAGFDLGMAFFVTITAGGLLGKKESLPASDQRTVPVTQMQIPKEARDELKAAQRESARNHPKKAITHLKKALQLAPNSSAAYNNLAVEYTRLGKMNEALKALKRAIEINAENPTAYRNIGVVYMKQKQPKEAIPYLEKSYKLNARELATLMLLGEAHYLTHGYTRAAASFKAACGLEPKNSTGHLYLANSYARLGRYGEAISQYRFFLSLEGKGRRADRVREVIGQLQKLKSGSSSSHP